MLNTSYYGSNGPSLSVIPPSHSQSADDCSIEIASAGNTSSPSLQDIKESDIIPKSASVKSLVFISIKF